jgi:hypothetical protein
MIVQINTVRVTCDLCRHTSVTLTGEGRTFPLPSGWSVWTEWDIGLTGYARDSLACPACSPKAPGSRPARWISLP